VQLSGSEAKFLTGIPRKALSVLGGLRITTSHLSILTFDEMFRDGREYL
jgi:hypothetical protein